MAFIIRVFFIFLVITPLQAFAARAPDIIEKSFVIRGKDADSAAVLLGMNAFSASTLKLPWDSQASKRNCTWGEVPANSSWKRCEDLPPLENIIDYIPGTPSELRLSGHWFDYTTASGPRFAIFQFGSPAFHVGQELSSDWNILLHGAISRVPMTMQEGFNQVKIPIGKTPPFLEVVLKELSDGQRRLFISMDFDNVELHKKKLLANKECHSKYGHLDGGPC
jgi:hypothetical protein